jgi:hypothetical protein
MTDWNRYGLAPGQFDRMVAEQGRVCAICRAVPDRPLFVDHDHRCCPGRGKTCGECTRGLLCPGCNTKLAALEQGPDWLHAAMAYLADHGAMQWCKKGHRLEPMPSGACRACARQRAAKYYAARGKELRRLQSAAA